MAKDTLPSRRQVFAGLGGVSAGQRQAAAEPPMIADAAGGRTPGGYGDPKYTEPYIDVDEWRDQPRRYRYVHGGFKGTDLRFSGYFLPKDEYKGRFFQYLDGGFGGTEHSVMAADGRPAPFGSGVDNSFKLGGYLIESNLGHTGDMAGIDGDGRILNYRASAATARYLRTVAAEMYGTAPKYGYLYGVGSRLVKSLENVDGLWQGGVAQFLEVPSINIPVTMNAMRVCGGKWDQIVDAVEPGGSGNPFDGLSYQQAEALALLYRTGYPRGSEFLLPRLILTWSTHFEELRVADPAYLTDFWDKAGYLGHDNPDAIGEQPMKRKVRVKEVLTAAQVNSLNVPDLTGVRGLLRFRPNDSARIGLRVEGLDPTQNYTNTRLHFDSGSASGREMYALGSLADVLIVTGPLLRPPSGVDAFRGVDPGDELTLDNRDFLAACFHGAHQLVDRYANLPTGWADSVNGMSVQPQRKLVDLNNRLEPFLTGRLMGKLILLANAHDSLLPPVHAETYKRLVYQAEGASAGQKFRLWWMDHADHLPVSYYMHEDPGFRFTAKTRLIDYGGGLAEALLSMVEWVESQATPSPTSGYVWGQDNSLEISEEPASVFGIQPVVKARVGRGDRIDVKVGQPVTLSYEAAVPLRSNRKIAEVRWDLDGSGGFAVVQPGGPQGLARSSGSITHAFVKPGTYFPAIRVRSSRDGTLQGPGGVTENLDWVRVVVS